MRVLFVRCLLLLAAFTSTTLAESGTDVDNLLTYLFTTQGYNKKVRPLKDQTRALNIATDFVLNSVVEFDEQKEKLTTSGYLSFFWQDDYLTWTPSSYNDTTEIFIPQDDIWKPDVSLRNAFKTFTGLGSSYLNVRVTSTGAVEWFPYQVLESTCSVDITYFPFDTQTCQLKFTAWSYSKAEVELDKGSRGILLQDYSPNAAWTLTDTSAWDTNTNEAAAVFELKLKRKSGFYIINVIMPVVFLSILSVFTFLLPVSSGERAGFSVTVFLSLAVFLTIVASELPKNSENTSLLAVYLMLMSSLSTVIVVLCLFEVRIQCRDVSEQPVNNAYMAFVKIYDFMTCTKRSKCVAPDKITSKISVNTEESDTQTDWKHVTDAMDFVFFWSALVFTFVCTLVLGAVAVNN